jgi:hypothetical protein
MEQTLNLSRFLNFLIPTNCRIRGMSSRYGATDFDLRRAEALAMSSLASGVNESYRLVGCCFKCA